MIVSIPVYSADGSLYACVSEQSLARLQAAGLVSRVVRHRKGHINRAILFIQPGEPKLMSASSVMGTRYSFKEPLRHGQVWELNHLGGGRDGKNYAPLESRAAFGQVVADGTSHETSSEHRWGGASSPGTIESLSERHAVCSSKSL